MPPFDPSGYPDQPGIPNLSGYPDQPQQPAQSWGNYLGGMGVATGLSVGGNLAGEALAPFTGGLSYPALSFLGGATGELGRQWIQDEPFNLGLAATEGGLNLIPGGKAAPGLLGAAKQGVKMGAVQGALGSVPRSYFQTGELPSLGQGLTDVGFGGVFGGATGAAMHFLPRKPRIEPGAGAENVDLTPPPDNLKNVGGGSTVPPGGGGTPMTDMNPYVEVSINNPRKQAELEALGYKLVSSDGQTMRFVRKDAIHENPPSEPTNPITEVPSTKDPNHMTAAQVIQEFGNPVKAVQDGKVEVYNDGTGTLGYRRVVSSEPPVREEPPLSAYDEGNDVSKGETPFTPTRDMSQDIPLSEGEVEAKYRMSVAQAVHEGIVERVVVNGEVGYIEIQGDLPIDGIGGFRHIGDPDSRGGAADEPPNEYEIRHYLGRMLGREPTAEEVQRAVDRQARTGEFTGRVAPFPPPEILAMRHDDLGNVPTQQELPGFLRPGEGEPGIDLNLPPVEQRIRANQNEPAPFDPTTNDVGPNGPREALPGFDEPIPQQRGQQELPLGPYNARNQFDLEGQGELFDSNTVYIPEREALGVTDNNQLPLKLQTEAYWKKHIEGSKADLARIDQGLSDSVHESGLSHDWAMRELRGYRDGSPGLTREGNDFIYRDPDGKPVAVMYIGGLHRNAPNGPEIITFAADKTRGLLYGRAVFALAKQAKEVGALTSGSGYSTHSANFARKIKKFATNEAAPFGIEGFKAPTQQELPGIVSGGVASPKTIVIPSIGGGSGKGEPPIHPSRIRELPPRPGDPPRQPPGNVPPDKVPPGSRPPPPEVPPPPPDEVPSKPDTPWSEKSFWEQTYDLVRNLTTGMDISAPMRQGLPLIATKQWWTSWKGMFQAWGSQAAYDINQKTITDHYLFKPRELANGKRIAGFGQRMGLRLIDHIDHVEEVTASTLLEKYVPGFKASNRAYNAFLNKLRADTFTNLIEEAERLGKDPFNNEKLAREIAEMVNTATGAASLKMDVPSFMSRNRQWNFEQSAKTLGYFLFSPRQTFSRGRMMNPLTYANADPFVRKKYMRAMVSSLGAWGTFAGLAAASGYADEVSLDPTSADFMKVRVGKTRLDAGGGFQQYFVALARLLSGQRTTSASTGGRGNTQILGQGYQARTGLDVAQMFFSNKLHPLTKFGYDFLAASEYQPFHTGDKLAQLIVPLYMQDVYEIIKEDRPEILPMLFPAAIGMGTQTYEAGEASERMVPKEYDYLYKGGERPWSGLYRK